MITVEIANEQSLLPVDADRLREAVRGILRDAGFRRAEISVAVVDDATMQELHQRYLQQDEPTDVLSFVLEQDTESLEGEVIVSADTAVSMAKRYGWSAEEELLLYVIHGTLHLVGYDDTTAEKQGEMQQQERAYLARLGIEGRYEELRPRPRRSAREGKGDR